MSEKKPMYIRMLNPTPCEVNKKLEDGYSLHTVNYHNANLIYHLIREETREPKFGLDYTFPDLMLYGEKAPEININKDFNWHDNQ